MRNVLRISHTLKCDLIVQSNATGTRRIRALSWWELWRKQFVEIPMGDNEILVVSAPGHDSVVIRTEHAIEPDTGKPIRNIA